MNILPLKKWHVRRKENVERVRRDEAEARAKEEELQKRAEIAEREARIEYMKKRAREREGLEDQEPTETVTTTTSPATPAQNINFFSDLQQGVGAQVTNAEHDAEKKSEQEKYEKRLGILNYLVDKDKSETPWYQKSKASEVSAKASQRKDTLDPMIKMNQYVNQKKKAEGLPIDRGQPSTSRSEAVVKERRHSKELTSEAALHKTHKHKHKKQKHKIKEKVKSDKESSIEKLRRERRKREEAERAKSEAMLKRHFSKEQETEPSTTSIVEQPGRYFSQFNPHLARQQRTDK